SNWDAVILVTAAYIFKVKLSWFIKEAAFFWPLGPIVRFFGGVPIDRSARRNMVAQAIDQFASRDHFILAVPPEATRNPAPHWQRGFTHMADGPPVPTALGYTAYRRKVAALGPAFVPTGDIEADFKTFADFYSRITPKFPDHFGPVIPRPEEQERGERRAQ